jgi:hypothetical protein
VVRNKGQSYETDAEFYAEGDRIWLLVEAKRNDAELEKVGEFLNGNVEIDAVPRSVKKEIAYLFELRPEYVWLVAPWPD